MNLTLTEWLLIGILIVNLWFFLVINHNQCEEYKQQQNISSGNYLTRQEIVGLKVYIERNMLDKNSMLQLHSDLRYIENISNIDDRLRKIERDISGMHTALGSLYSIEKSLENLDSNRTVWIEKNT